MDEADRSTLYRFDELGWAQFEMACSELLAELGLRGLAWTGRADEGRVAIAAASPPPVAGRLSPGPSLIVCAWLVPGDAVDSERRHGQVRRVARRLLDHASDETLAAVVVLTNATALDDTERALLSVAGPAPVVLGARELTDLFDGLPVARRRAPSLLGVRDLGGLIADETRMRSSWDEAAARELAQVFVPTEAYLAALSVLETHHFAVLTGPPEMGKTAAARVLGLVKQAEGWEVHECIRPEEVRAALAPDRPQVFISDDAFGSTEFRPDAAERWAVELDGLLRHTDARHWLVWTSRPAPLRASLARIHREHGVERFPRPSTVIVDAAALDIEEKATILYRHARAAGLPEAALALVRSHGLEIVDHSHFTPERIRRFVAARLSLLAGTTRTHRPHVTDVSRSLQRAIAEAIAQPTQAMVASFDALPDEHRSLLVALVDTPPGPVAERDLAAAARRHSPRGLPQPAAELVDRLTDQFLRVVPPNRVTWVHPSWRDLVIERLATDAGLRARFLERCSLDGALLALSRAGGAAGHRRRPLLVSDGDWDALTQRLYDLIPELSDPDLARVLATLDDALAAEVRASADEAELVPVAATALRRIASCWRTGRTIANAGLIERWRTIAAMVEDPGELPYDLKLWTPPPRTRDPTALPYLVDIESEPAVAGRRGSDARRDPSRIVTRILADLRPPRTTRRLR